MHNLHSMLVVWKQQLLMVQTEQRGRSRLCCELKYRKPSIASRKLNATAKVVKQLHFHSNCLHHLCMRW